MKKRETEEMGFDVDSTISSSETVGPVVDVLPPISETLNSVFVEEASPVFRLLSRPELPELGPEMRARLMMQSPTRLFFYWSVDSGAFHALRKAVGETVGYRLALRLLDVKRETEEVHAVETTGSWWFNVRQDSEYRAEIGFYSPSRPFVRLLFSNTVATPRKKPSEHSSNESRWAVTTHAFAQILDASGFQADAYEVAVAESLARSLDIDRAGLAGLDEAELRRVISLLEDGTPLEDFKWKVSPELFALIHKHFRALSEFKFRSKMIDVDREADGMDVESRRTAVHGSSLVHFPSRPKYRPISSIDLS
jgi:hypothetical protein